MAAIALRSPQYKYAAAGTGANSAKLIISIDGTIQYTLVKDFVLDIEKGIILGTKK